MSKNIMYEWVLVKILVIVSFVGMIAANAAAVVLPLNGISTKGVSDLYPNLFTPAPYTFSIWGVIYLALAGFIIMFSVILIASIVVIQNKDYIYPLVILWAYGGILNNHFSASGFGGHYYSIMIATVVCMVIMLVVTVTRSLYRE